MTSTHKSIGLMETRASDKPNALRLLLLGDARQVHLEKWARYFTQEGYDVLTFSLEKRFPFPGRMVWAKTPNFIPDFIRYPASVPRLKKIIGEFNPHVINAHFLPNYGMMAALAAGSPWVLSTWGSDIMLQPYKSSFHMWRTRFVLDRAAFVTSDARIMTERIIELGFDDRRVLTVPYGVDLSVFKLLPRAESDRGPRILSNRKLEKVYNIDTILKAFPIIRKALPQASLSIVGDGSMKRQLMQMAGDLGVRKEVSFMENLAHDMIPLILHDHDIFVSVSFSDTTSVSLLEAMACGTFPIVSDIPANREWISDGANGLLVPPGDCEALANAVIQVWRNRGIIEKTGLENRRMVENRADWKKNMEEVAKLYGRVLEQIP